MRIDVYAIDADTIRFDMRVHALVVGTLRIARVSDKLLMPPCMHAVRMLRTRYRRARPAWRVVMASIDGPHRQRGHGAAFYAAVIRYLATRGGILVRDACTLNGSTSEAADRVWRSRQLGAEVAVVDGLAAWGGT